MGWGTQAPLVGGEPGGCCRVATPMGDGCVAVSKVASLLSGLSKEKPLLAAQAGLCPASRPAPRASAALCSGHASALALALGTLGHSLSTRIVALQPVGPSYFLPSLSPNPWLAK